MTSVRIGYGLILGFGIAGFLIWLLIQGILVPNFQSMAMTEGNELGQSVYPLATFLLAGVVPMLLLMGVFWYIRSIKEYQFFNNNRGRF